MLEQFIQDRIIAQLPFAANEGQLELLHQLSQFLTSPIPRKAFILRGYAGTGKTSIMAALVQAMKQLQQHVILLAPTGRAAKVLSKYAHTPAYTIHKYIYRQKQLGENRFSLNDNLHRHALFIVDEASMISAKADYRSRIDTSGVEFGSGNLLDDLVRYVYSGEGCRLLLLGDDAQLPPVGSIVSPALCADYMAGYQLTIYSHTLTQVARQALDSAILHNANILRPLALGQVSAQQGHLTDTMWQYIQPYGDVGCIGGAELMEAIEQAYREVGIADTIVLTRTNKRTNIYNQGIRTRILWKEEEIAAGDRIMVSKNNYFWTEKYDDLPFLANGDMLEVVRLRNIRELYGYRFADAQLKALDYEWEIDATIWLDTLTSDNPEANNRLHHDLFCKIAEDYPELQHNRKQLTEAVYQSPYYNALQIRMAYAVTGHKSQGGQWARVFIDPYMGGDPNPQPTPEEVQDFYRWLYTAVTRATQKVYLIKK